MRKAPNDDESAETLRASEIETPVRPPSSGLLATLASSCRSNASRMMPACMSVRVGGYNLASLHLVRSPPSQETVGRNPHVDNARLVLVVLACVLHFVEVHAAHH